MHLYIHIQLGNAGMLTDADVIRAITHSRLVGSEPTTFEVGESGKLYDKNGNRIGSWHVQDKSVSEERTRETDNDYRKRIGKCIPKGAWYTAEELGDASGEELDSLGDRYNCKRKAE
jgi:hypothetical protein